MVVTEDVQETYNDNKYAFNPWSHNGNPQCRVYKECKKNCKIVMTIAKGVTMQEWYDKLNTKCGAKKVKKIEKMRLG